MFLILFFIIKSLKILLRLSISAVYRLVFNQRRNDSIDYIVKARYSFLAMKS